MRVARVWLAFLVAAGGGEEHEKGLELYAKGDFAAAAEAFRAAIAAEGASPELCYNLALALWRAGKPDEAETAAEQAATLSDGRLSALRDGILGNLRFDAARAAAAAGQDLQSALALAEQARDHFVRGALQPGAGAELARNLERAQALADQLRQQLEEQQKQQDQSQQQDGDKGDKEEEEDEQKGDEQSKGKSEQNESEKNEPEQNEPEQKEKEQNEPEQKEQENEQENEEPQPEEPQPEQPKSEQQQSQEPESEEQQNEEQSGEGKPEEPRPEEPQSEAPKSGQAESPPAAGPEKEAQEQLPAPGEQDQSKLLTPEQKQRLLEKLRQLDAELQQLRQKQQARRPRVEKDW